MCLKKRKHEVAISDLQMKLVSAKKHHDNRLKQIENRILNIENRFDMDWNLKELKSAKSQSDTRLTQIENRFDDRLNQIEKRFANLEGRQNKPDSRKRYDNVDDYYYGPDY